MKKILSMLVLSALLLATLAISASAAAYFDYGNLNTRVNVKKSTSVVIDGVISEGEYEEYTDGYTEWFVAENASDYFGDAETMAQSAKWYFSWDGEYFNIAAQFDAGQGADQTYAGGDYYGDYAFAGSDEFVVADSFLGYGPGLNIKSSEQSPADELWTKLFYAISENTATGEKITGTYSDQNGQNLDYQASHNDFDFNYNGSVVTVEYRLPVYELLETFKPNQGGQMFKATIVLTAGVAGQFATDAETGEPVDVQPATYCWGVRLGQFGYACDSGNTDKVYATFRLLDESVPNDQPPVTTPEPPVTTPEPPVTTPEPPVTTPDVPDQTPDTPDQTPDTPDAPEQTPDAPDQTPDTPVNPDKTPVAPNTGDIMVVAAVVSAISACGAMIAKKRK